MVLPAYLAAAGIGFYLIGFPLTFYGSFILEHTFALSRQKLRDWCMDQMKAGILSYVIGLILIGVFYFTVVRYPHTWWLIISVFQILFSIVLAKLVPVVVIPLFFKYKPLADTALKERIVRLGERMAVDLNGVYEIDFSRKTTKANAAFTGLGRTKRVILADTLKDKYTHDEIEVILAHEFAHYKRRHIPRLIVINSLVTLGAFYLIYAAGGGVLRWFGFDSIADLAAFPAVLLFFAVFGIVMQPFQAYMSRRMEREADRMSLEATGMKSACISMMEKLSAQNLSDRSPHPIIKVFFFDHPPADERIALARSCSP